MRNGREARPAGRPAAGNHEIKAVPLKGRRPGGADTDQLALGLASTDVDDLAPLQDTGIGFLDGAHSLDVQSPEVAAAAATATTRADEILAGLTDEQRDAVTHAAGPLLIVAGAGTGKTAVITRRIAHLIATKEARPSEILALTFTDRAAAEMEERVDRFVPYGYTDTWISTFHAFGDRVLRENALHLGLSPDFRVLSRPEQVIFMRERLFQLPLDYFRPLGDPTRYVDALITLWSRAKDEAVTPEDYAAYAERLAAEAASQPDNAALAEQARQQRELAATYRAYQTMLAEASCVDFGDLIVLTLRLLREHPSVREAYQSQFRYLLVDEFQDTNFAQFELVKLLAGGRRNLTVVADDDQAIYRWRGASYSNISYFTEAYPDARMVVLTRNFRSTQLILDSAYRLIRHNDPDRLEVRHGIDKRLRSATEPGQLPRHHQFETLAEEADDVAGRIEDAVRTGRWRYRDVAILVRANRDADPFMRALNMRGIPFTFTGTRGLYDREEIRFLTAFLRVLAHPSDSMSLYLLSSSPFYDVPPADLALCTSYGQRRNRSLNQVYRALPRLNDLEVSAPGRAVIAKIVEDLDAMGRLAATMKTGRVLYEYAVTHTGYVHRLAASEEPADAHRVANIARFFDLVARYGESAKVDRVPAFVEYLELLIEAGDDPATAEAEADTDAVRVLTIHKAKGLEFPVVFLVSLVAEKFPSRARREPLALPDALMRDILPSGDFHLQEERRLCYVGMTRARRELYLTGAWDYGGVRRRKVSRFVLEALDLPRIEPAAAAASPAQAVERHAPPAAPAEGPIVLLPPSDDPVPLSFRQVDDYTTCPYKYRYIHVLRVPILRDHRIAYGAALHEAVQEYNRRRARRQPVTADDLVATLERAWISEGFLSREHEDRRLEEGRAVLRRFFAYQEAGGTVPTFVEREFRFRSGGAYVRGRWDRVDIRGNDVVIIDFKSTDVRTQEDADRRTRDSEQLAIYSLAYQEVLGRLPDRVELHFLGREIMVGRAHKDAEDVTEAREMIERAAEGIRARQFTATPDPYRACPYCAFKQICPFTAAE
ncbi:MAG TPA: UvrD-helicase domain-containing protein [bacterium]|nr:UvrD-helicase domain-containing protein [bacterium]